MFMNRYITATMTATATAATATAATAPTCHQQSHYSLEHYFVKAQERVPHL